MPPKKAKKIPLNEFLGDSTLGSWADEMDSLPSAPAARNEDDHHGRHFDRYPRKDDFTSTRPDRPPRDDVPLPTQPPYTAFIGNLSFDLTESELEEFFGPFKAKSVKIIRDREDKPKGFGYVEFEELDGLKDALSKSGSNFSGRMIRVSVAEPPKERTTFGGTGGGPLAEDDSKFDSPWRRDGPLPDHGNPREPSRRRFDGSSSTAERALPSVAESTTDWRANRPPRPSAPEEPPTQRKSGFSTPETQPSAADQAEVWTKGSRISTTGSAEDKTGSLRHKAEPSAADEGDWRIGKPKTSTSPNNSTPPTPQMGRKKLELLPRSGNASTSQTPLSSPKMASAHAAAPSVTRSNPFGSARPVDITSREKEVTERIEKERETVNPRLTISRTNSRQATERSPLTGARTPPASASTTGSTSPKLSSPAVANTPVSPRPALGPSVRPSLSFASAAAARKDNVGTSGLGTSVEKLEPSKDTKVQDDVEKITDKVSELVA